MDLPWNDPRASLLVLAVGPVQQFIERARSVRDLWTGSLILSVMAARAMGAVASKVDFVSPSLDRDPSDPPDPLRILREAGVPCLPNRFLALVPDDPEGRLARDLAATAATAARGAWADMARAVREALQKEHAKSTDAVLASAAGSWDRLWDPQVEGYFQVRTAVCPPEARSAAILAPLLGQGWDASRPGAVDWGWVELANRLLDAHKLDGHIPASAAERSVPQKCTLMATFEQMGPADLKESRNYWDAFAGLIHPEGVRLRRGEALSAVALTRRFAWGLVLRKELRLAREKGVFPDTATVAAATWLKQSPELDQLACKDPDWSGQWLHWKSRDEDPDEKPMRPEVWELIRRESAGGRPPTYYAVLALDADKMHKWLQGERTRPGVGPEFLQAFSRVLVGFARDECRKIVEEEHGGTLVYAGGDDTLALVPAAEALACARDLRAAFRKSWDGDEVFRAALPDGQDLAELLPDLSAGIAVVHHKEDLRLALALARGAEQAAKEWGGGAIGLKIARRSGEESGVLMSWDLAERARTVFLDPFLAGATDRWLYSLRTEAGTLSRPDLADVAEIEVRRRATRAEEGKARVDPTAAVSLLRDHRLECELRESESESERGALPASYGGDPFTAFVILGQSASFLARGRD